VAIRVRAMSRLEGGFFGEDSSEHMCGNSGIDELVGCSEKVIVVAVETIFKGFGACGEFLL